MCIKIVIFSTFLQESPITCAVAEHGVLIFGDESGNVSITDRNFTSVERRCKLFKGQISGLAYVYDPSNSNRQYVIAIGDDARSKEDHHLAHLPSQYMIKVHHKKIFTGIF